MTTMSQARAQMIVGQLSTHFQFKSSYRVRCAGRGSVHNRSRMEIRLGAGHSGKPDTNRLHTLLHEFTHALDYERGTFVREDKHGPGFSSLLVDVIDAAYTLGYDVSVQSYPWHEEYGCVYSYAVRKGYTTRPHAWKTRVASQVA